MTSHAVLLHGLGRSSRSMRPVERALVRHGYAVLNVSYRSRTADIETLAADVAMRIVEWEPTAPLDFVTHSLGGILLRVAVAEEFLSARRVRRVVMLGPPNGGSELVDVIPELPVVGSVFKRMSGPAGAALGTGPDGVAATLPPVPFEVGVIAGNRSFNPVFSKILGEPNDGKVRVSRTKVAGMRDFLVVPQWHPLLMATPAIVAQAIRFLEFGSFDR